MNNFKHQKKSETSEFADLLEVVNEEGFEDLEDHTDRTTTKNQRRFMFEHSSCAMCDTKLEIRHEINKNDLKIKEEAHCPSCMIRVRIAHHLLH